MRVKSQVDNYYDMMTSNINDSLFCCVNGWDFSSLITGSAPVMQMFASGPDDNIIGSIVLFGSDIIPSSYLQCDGSLIPKADYPDLYKAIGDKFTTNCSMKDHFNIPTMESTDTNLKYIIKAK